MSKKDLVIVESPKKAKTIGKLLGKSYDVKSTMGHIRDLPKSKLGVDVENGFAPKYVMVKGKDKVVRELKKAAKQAASVFLAPDPDREGEAISWHLFNVLSSSNANITRVTFNEITRDVILDGLSHSGQINSDLVNSQQTRRILDRLVGYQVSPLLWRQLGSGASAGRVQTVALRLVVEREEEIEAFKAEEYWTIHADVSGESNQVFRAAVITHKDEKFRPDNEKDATAARKTLEKSEFSVVSVVRKARKRHPSPPYITSTLQQDASAKLNFTAKRTMRLAQQLYEGVDAGSGPVGLITYMRTDSVRISPQAVNAARKLIGRLYTNRYVPEKPRFYKVKKSAQDAHEAIRPTDFDLTPEVLSKVLNAEQLKLYRLIWNRFLACQMASAEMDQTSVDIQAGPYGLRANGSIITFDGFMRVMGRPDEKKKKNSDDADKTDVNNGVLPPITDGENLECRGIEPVQHFTKPPPRYSEASLIRTLEENGIGRPSTYASIVGTIQDRRYVERVSGRLMPTDVGRLVSHLLIGAFPKIFETGFTSDMEEKLDEIERGRMKWVGVLDEFYNSFKDRLESAPEKMHEVRKSLEVETDEKCEACGKPMHIKYGRYGKFLACSGYPKCRTTRPLAESGGEGTESDIPADGGVCDKCKTGRMKLKHGRFGPFYACENYPECKNTRNITKSLGVPCPVDGCTGELTARRSRRGKVFYGCSEYPKCDYSVWDLPVLETCPDCGWKILVRKNTKTRKGLACPQKDCKYFKADPDGSEE